MLVLLVERSLWILMVAGEPMEVVPFLAKTIRRWTDLLRMQPVGWPSLLWKQGSVAVFWFRYGLLWTLLFSEGLFLFSFTLNTHRTRHCSRSSLGDDLGVKKGRSWYAWFKTTVTSLIAYQLLEAGTFILLAFFLDSYWALRPLTLTVMEMSMGWLDNGEES